MLAHVRALAVTPEMLRWAQGAGRIVRLARGVYIAAEAVATDPVGAHLQRALAHQLLSPDSIASHETAALAWGLDLDDDWAAARAAPRFIVPPGPAVRSRRTASATTHTRSIPVHHRLAHPSGLITTSPARAAIEVAAAANLPEALVVLDSAARMRLAELVGSGRMRDAYANEHLVARSVQPLRDAAEHVATHLTRARLSRAVELADPRREAPSESRSFAHIVLAGLPAPRMQARIDTEAGPAWPDFLWAQARVIGEVDGKVKYTDPEVLVREKVRQEALERLGFAVIRWMAEEARTRPTVFLRRLERVLG